MKLSLNQIDIDRISSLIVKQKNIVFKEGEEAFSTTSADDTDFVDNQLSKDILISLEEDRTTAKNALMLGGIPAEDYLSILQNKDIKTNIGKMKLAFGNDINDIKTELISLKKSLMENGYIEQNSGYFEISRSFKDKEENHYNVKAFGDCSQGNNDTVLMRSDYGYNKFSRYQFVCITNPSNNKFDIRQIVEMHGENREIVLDSPVSSSVISEQVELTKTKGFVHQGDFKFADEIKARASEDDLYTGLSDDTYKTTRKINIPNKGFGYSFRIPENKQGFIAALEICSRAHGNPGDLICYIIDEKDLYKFKNPNQAQHDAEAYKAYGDDTGFSFFIKSKPTSLKEDDGLRYVKFDFKNIDGTYPLPTIDTINHTNRYVAIIKALDVDEENYYDIIFVQHKENEFFGDLELNNRTFYYDEKPMDSNLPALTPMKDLEDCDLYYGIITKKVIESRPEPTKCGLYTFHCGFDRIWQKSAPEKLSVVLKVKREGIFNAMPDNITPKVYIDEPIPIRTNGYNNIEDAKLISLMYKPYQSRTDKNNKFESVKTVIGNNVAEIVGISSQAVTTKKPVLVTQNDKLYRMGYIVSVTAKRITTNSNGVVDESVPETLILPLTEVFESSTEDSNDENYSDNLLFEIEIENAYRKKYNDFEIQVFWENQEMSEYENRKMALMGAIRNISFYTKNSRSLSLNETTNEEIRH